MSVSHSQIRKIPSNTILANTSDKERVALPASVDEIIEMLGIENLQPSTGFPMSGNEVDITNPEAGRISIDGRVQIVIDDNSKSQRTDNDVALLSDLETQIPTERIYHAVVNTESGTPIEFTLPVAIIKTNIVKLFVNGVLEAYDGFGLSVNVNKVIFTPTNTINDANISLFYFASAREMPKDISEVSVNFTIQNADTTITSAITLAASLAGSEIKIDWGDGNEETVIISETLSTSPSHTYQTAGTFEVKIIEEYGKLTSVRFNSQSEKVVTSVNKIKSNSIISLASMFASQPVLEFPPEFKFETPNATNATSVFSMSGIETIPANIFDNCVKITSVNGIFQNSAIREIPEGLFDAMSELITASSIAKAAVQLTTVGKNLLKNKTKLTGAAQSFYGCTSLATIGDGMLDGCSALLDANGLLQGCTMLEEIPENTLRGCVLVSNLANFAQGVNKLTTLHENLFSDCHEATNISGMLKNNNTIITLPAGLLRAMTKINNASSAFGYMSALTSVGVGFLNPISENCENPSQLFRATPNITGNINDIISVPFPKASNVSYLFSGCKFLTGSGNSVIALFTLPPTTTNGAFATCTGLSDFASIPSTWK